MATFEPAYREAATAAARAAADRLPSRRHLVTRCTELETAIRHALLEHALDRPTRQQRAQPCWCETCQILRPTIGGARFPARPDRPDHSSSLPDLRQTIARHRANRGRV